MKLMIDASGNRVIGVSIGRCVHVISACAGAVWQGLVERKELTGNGVDSVGRKQVIQKWISGAQRIEDELAPREVSSAGCRIRHEALRRLGRFTDQSLVRAEKEGRGERGNRTAQRATELLLAKDSAR